MLTMGHVVDTVQVLSTLLIVHILTERPDDLEGVGSVKQLARLPATTESWHKNSTKNVRLNIRVADTCVCNVHATRDHSFWPCKDNGRVKRIFYQTLSTYRKRTVCWKVPRTRPFVLLVRATYRRINMEHQWNYIYSGEPKYWEKNLSQFHCVHNKHHKDLGSNPSLRRQKLRHCMTL